MPFFYASLSLIWTYYWVDEKIAAPFLKDTRLKPARFSDPEAKGKTLISLNFQNYGSLLGMMVGTCNEIEFNIHAYPAKSEREVPVISLVDYLRGQEQTKLIGEFRLHVPADNQVAVEAGIGVFGERKFLANFNYNVPSLNGPDVTSWDYSVMDNTQGKNLIYELKTDFSGIQSAPGNGSPITLYSMLPGGPNRPPGGKDMDLIGSRWNMFGMYEDFLNLRPSDQSKFKLKIGNSTHPMVRDLKVLLGRSPKVVAARTFHSPPAAAENRAFYVDLGTKTK